MKNKETTIFFALIVLIIIAVMIIANYRQSLVMELRAPTGGVRKLFTCSDNLVAVSNSNEVWVWKWDKLQLPPIKASTDAIDITLMENNKLVWIPRTTPGKIVIGDFSGKKIDREFDLGFGLRAEMLKSSRNGKYTVVAAIGGTEENKTLKCFILTSEATSLNSVINLNDLGENFDLGDIDISDTGNTVAVVGKKDTGWIAVIDTKEENMLWEKSFSEAAKITKLALSGNDSLICFNKNNDVCIYDLKNQSKLNVINVESKLHPDNNYISAIKLTLRNNLIVVGGMYLDLNFISLKEKKMKRRINTGHHIFSEIAIDPDSNVLATSDLRGDGIIKIWKIPGN